MNRAVSTTADQTAGELAEYLKAFGRSEQVVVVSNREPFRHDVQPDGGFLMRHMRSGLVNAVEPLLQACSGVWVAHGSGSADRPMAPDRDGVDVPPDNPAYRLRRVWMDEHEERGYYDGFANEALWPLCHYAYVRPVFRPDDFDLYWTVNARFAEAVAQEIASESALVLVQDYHLALAPAIISERHPETTVVMFWHIPWPSWQVFEICPWRHQLLAGMLGSRIVGFQTATDSRNFMDSVERCLEAHIDRDEQAITYGGRRVLVRVYPVSVPWPNPCTEAAQPVSSCRESVRRGLGLPADIRVGLGVDRLDYTKGLEHKLLAVERLLECYPEFRERFVFVQLAQPSRVRLAAYRNLRTRLLSTVERLNRTWSRNGWKPVRFLEGEHTAEDVYEYYRGADFCCITSLHDGMNLVGKEFVSARDDEQGALVLSAFAGAARELRDALVVNPYDVDATVQALARALTMSSEEQRDRMQEMRAVVAQRNASWWAAQILADAALSRRVRQWA